MNATTIAPAETLVLTRLIKVPRARIFAAWTSPEIAQWICTGERQVIKAKVDPRVGGEYDIQIKTENGEHKFSGVYREVTPPSRVVFTWNLGDCMPEFKGVPTQVTVDLEEQKGGTLVTLTHEGLPTAEVRDKHSGGWNLSFDNLEKLA